MVAEFATDLIENSLWLDHPLTLGGMRSAAIGDDVVTFFKNPNRSS
jgi:hypothetical protein